LHGWWFDVASGSMYAYDPAQNRFKLINRAMVKQIAPRLERFRDMLRTSTKRDHSRKRDGTSLV
jgi:hypothetical protein